MGLFDMFKKKEPRITIPTGPSNAGVYVYDWRRLPKATFLDELVVDYVPGKHKMVSSNGNESVTEGALSYKGRIFGCTFHPDAISKLKRVAKHGPVSCTIVCTDDEKQYWSLALPRKKEFADFLKTLGS